MYKRPEAPRAEHYLSKLQKSMAKWWKELAVCDYHGQQYTFGELARKRRGCECPDDAGLLASTNGEGGERHPAERPDTACGTGGEAGAETDKITRGRGSEGTRGREYSYGRW